MMRNQDECAIDVLKTGPVVGNRAGSRFARQKFGTVLIRICHPGDFGLPAQFSKASNVERSDPSAANQPDLVNSHLKASLPGVSPASLSNCGPFLLQNPECTPWRGVVEGR